MQRHQQLPREEGPSVVTGDELSVRNWGRRHEIGERETFL
jgi:hypothetical protein